jgi:hypothetical protein
MPQSYKKRRQREAPIRQLGLQVRRELHRIAAELGRELLPHTERYLVSEVIRLSDPWNLPGIDAALPAQRWDLRDKWLRQRLHGAGETAAERERLAREIAPTPDVRAPSGGARRWGEPTGRVSYGRAFGAFRARRKRLALPFN